MDISKLPIMISDPAEQVRKNVLKIEHSSKPDVVTWDIYTEMRETINHLTELKKDKGLGVLLLTIHDNPGIYYYELIEKIDKKTSGFDVETSVYIDFAKDVGLVKEDKIDNNYQIFGTSSYIKRGYFITELGRNLLIQNELID